MLVVDVNMIKLQVVNTMNTVAIILVQVLFLTVINAEYWDFGNATDYGPSWKLERSKRVPFHRYIPPNTLTATIKDGDKEIHLTWNRVDRYVFNENLPIYTARKDSWGINHKKSNVMKSIGKTILYHDIAHKSMLMYVEKIDRFFGVVGQDYEILKLPFDEFSRPLVVGEQYVRTLPHHRLHGEDEILQRIGKSRKRKLDSSESGSSSSESDTENLPERYFVETLVFVAYDIFKHISDRDRTLGVETLIFNCLLHFSAVDMMFAMLPQDHFKLYINLAGIIIEEEDGMFSEILEYEPLRYNNRPQLIHDDRMFNIFEKYSSHYDFPFLRDSYDMILFQSRRQMVSDKGEYYAWGSPNKDIFKEKQRDLRRTSVPFLIIRYYDVYSQFPTVAHFIGKSLGIEKTYRRPGSPTNREKKCYSVMLHEITLCTNCLTWTRESISQLKDFLSDHTNRCFLLNVPRSLYPPGTKMMTLSPCRQCTCFQYHSYAEETTNECPLYIPPENCREPLQCKYWDTLGNPRIGPTILPFDGTPCGENKVCWDEECTSSSAPSSRFRV